MRPPAVHHLARVDNELFASRGHHSLPEVYVQGRAFFPDPTLAYVDGASFGGGCLRVGWFPAFRDCSRLTETGRAHVELRCIIQWIKRETIRQVLPGCMVTHDERPALPVVG